MRFVFPASQMIDRRSEPRKGQQVRIGYQGVAMGPIEWMVVESNDQIRRVVFHWIRPGPFLEIFGFYQHRSGNSAVRTSSLAKRSSATGSHYCQISGRGNGDG